MGSSGQGAISANGTPSSFGVQARDVASGRRRLPDFVRPDAEALERVRAERRGDRDVGRVATAGDEYPADARGVVARVERVPAAAEVGFEPTGKVHRSVIGRDTDIPEIARAVARRNIQAAAK